MNENPEMAALEKPLRFQFSLRFLLIMILALGAAMAWIGANYRARDLTVHDFSSADTLKKLVGTRVRVKGICRKAETFSKSDFCEVEIVTKAGGCVHVRELATLPVHGEKVIVTGTLEYEANVLEYRFVLINAAWRKE